MAYQEALLDPRWQRVKARILTRDDFTCIRCGRTDLTLHVHHRCYFGPMPWDTPDWELETLCIGCHRKEHEGRLGRSMFTLRQDIARAHSYGDWDEVWRLAHILEFDEAGNVLGN